jgi:hypothetical protein
MRPDHIALHHQYRARSTSQPKADYAAAVQIFRRPARHWPAILITAVVLLAAVYVGVRT